MADTHVLTSESGGQSVVCHIDVPAGNNAVGVPWQTAVANFRGRATVTSALKDGDGTDGTISAAELAQLQSGAVYEEVVTLQVDSAPSNAARVGALAALYTKTRAETRARLQEQLRYFGYTA